VERIHMRRWVLASATFRRSGSRRGKPTCEDAVGADRWSGR
jgi:hypothetical protein